MATISQFNDAYREKKVLVTGDTGFKGSWLCAWLVKLGATVVGYSIDIPTTPSNYEAIGLDRKITHIRGDIGDLENLKKVFNGFQPEIVFHLAAQALVCKSYFDPQRTFFSNLGGTVNILECIRNSVSVKAAVIITSDKCYQNVEWDWGYRENDRLGGDDPYSASKACAENAFHSYYQSFFDKPVAPKICSVRAGNVIGGGDWAEARIIPDCARALSAGRPLIVRNLKATRPWQHVLEPLSGYLLLGENLLSAKEGLTGEPFNFGPADETIRTVEQVIAAFAEAWGGRCDIVHEARGAQKEATLLKLCCDKARNRLKWRASLDFSQTVEMTVAWYKAYYERNQNMCEFTNAQIDQYVEIAQKKNAAWTALKTSIPPDPEIQVVKLKEIIDEKGKVMHMLRVDSPLFGKFGEIYFSFVNSGVIKGWKKHLKSTQFFAVPTGNIKMVTYDDRENSAHRGQVKFFQIGEGNYVLVKIPPNIWYSWQGISAGPAMIANCTDQPHDPAECVKLDLKNNLIPYSWNDQI